MFDICEYVFVIITVVVRLEMDKGAIKEALETGLPEDMEISGKVNTIQIIRGIWESFCETWQAQVLYDFLYHCKNGNFDQAWDLLDRFSLFFALVFLGTFSVCYCLSHCIIGGGDDGAVVKEPVVEEEVLDPRDFTEEQLRDFNGVKNPSIYVCLKVCLYIYINVSCIDFKAMILLPQDEVYDVTKSAE